MAMSSRLAKSLLAIAAVLLVGWSVVSACKYPPNSTEPVAGCFLGASPVTCNIAQVTVNARDPYVLLVDGQQYLQGSSSATVSPANLALGTHDLSGTISGDTLVITLASVTSTSGGLVKSGGVSNVSGPVGAVGSCAISYIYPAGATGPVPFDANFVIAPGSTISACRASP